MGNKKFENVKNGKLKGYAFVEFEKERDMHCKLKIKIYQYHKLPSLKITLGRYYLIFIQDRKREKWRKIT